MQYLLGDKIQTELTISHPHPKIRNLKTRNHTEYIPHRVLLVVVVQYLLGDKIKTELTTHTHTHTHTRTHTHTHTHTTHTHTHTHTHTQTHTHTHEHIHHSCCDGGCPRANERTKRRANHHGDNYKLHPPTDRTLRPWLCAKST